MVQAWRQNSNGQSTLLIDGLEKGRKVSRSKVLVWQDASGDIWLSCNHPTWLAKRQQLGQEAEATVNAQAAALEE